PDLFLFPYTTLFRSHASLRACPFLLRKTMEGGRSMNECLNEVRAHAPLVHCITNYVTVNDVANVILACGGSPIMSDEPQDVEDIDRKSTRLNSSHVS